MATSFTGPVKNAVQTDTNSARKWEGGLPIGEGEMSTWCTYFNDFLVAQDYAAADWVITTTEAGSGDATEALAADEACGALLITNDNADDDVDHLQLNEENWRLSSGKKLWFDCRIKVSDATQSDWFIGLGITDTTPFATSDRVGFEKNDGDANIDALCEKDTTETNTDTGSDGTDDTYVRLSFFWDGVDSITYFVNGKQKVEHTTNQPDDENLCVSISIQNGAAAAKTMTIDYIHVVQER